MSLAVDLQTLARLVRVTPASTPVAASRASGAAAASRANLLEAQRQLFDVFQAIVRLDTAVNGSSRLRLALPVARSEPGLALDLNSFAARLASSEEINATATSFTPFGPDWDGVSTSLLTVSGVYDGSNGSGELRFEVRRAGVRGIDQQRIRVYGPDGTPIRNFTVSENDPLDQLYSLQNGLAVTVGAGFLVNGDTAVMQVFDNVGSRVDPARPLGGWRNDNPNLQFGLPAIVNGSFQVNGETIAVTVTDSVNSVIDRINASAAGVTASFNAIGEQIEIMQDTVGEAPGIVLSGDSSNFLAATKLASAVATPGKDPDNQRPLEDLAVFNGTRSGEFTINGQSIALDVQNDSLDTVVARINGAGVGAVADFDPATGQVTLAAADGVSTLEIDSNGTGLFTALHLPEGRVDAEARAGGINLRRVKRIVDSIAAVANGLNALFNGRGLLNGRDPQVIALRNQLETAVSNVFGGAAGRLDSGIGLRFNRDRAAREQGRFVELDRRKLTQALERRGKRVGDFFNGSDQGAGFTAAVAGAVDRSIRSLASTLGARGSVLDVFA